MKATREDIALFNENWLEKTLDENRLLPWLEEVEELVRYLPPGPWFVTCRLSSWNLKRPDTNKTIAQIETLQNQELKKQYFEERLRSEDESVRERARETLGDINFVDNLDPKTIAVLQPFGQARDAADPCGPELAFFIAAARTLVPTMIDALKLFFNSSHESPLAAAYNLGFAHGMIRQEDLNRNELFR